MTTFRDEFTFVVALEDGFTFTFTVQDWDTEEEPLSDDVVIGMAHNLVMKDRVALHGSLSVGKPPSWWASHVTIIDPARVVGIFMKRS